MLANYLSDAMSKAEAHGDTISPFTEGLEKLVRRELGAPPRGLRRLTGGASQEIWSFDVSTADGDRGFVLRRSPGIALNDLFPVSGMEAEAMAIRAVAGQSVPVPAIAYVLRPEDGLDHGFIASRVAGEALGRKIVRDAAFDGVRPRLAAELGTILARIHRTPADGLPLPTLTPENSIERLEQYLRSSTEPRPVFDAALAWLWRNCPEPTAPRLVHGDFRTGNYLLTPDGVSAILDWEACHFGDPMEDLGWLCMPIWRFGRLDQPAGGVGTRAQLFDAYAHASGEPVDAARVRFWEIRGMMHWGLTCMFMAESFLRGDGHAEWAVVGRRASEAEIELLHALTRETQDA